MHDQRSQTTTWVRSLHHIISNMLLSFFEMLTFNYLNVRNIKKYELFKNEKKKILNVDR